MTTVRYARVKSTIADENSDDNANQLQTIDSEEEEDVLPPVKISSANANVNNAQTPYSVERNSIVRTIIWTGLLILCYFILSIGLTFYQRWLLKGFKFPFSVVIYHLFVKLSLATLFRLAYRVCTGKHRVRIPIKIVAKKVAPTSFFGAIDIGFSQWGLEFVDVALYTMVGQWKNFLKFNKSQKNFHNL